jgi:L-fuconolactonase
VVQVLINPPHIATVAPLLERHPALRIVIDHAANPDVSRPVSREWGEGLHRLAALPNTACKVSAFWLPGSPPPSNEQLLIHVGEIADAFGPQRLVAASNWPVTTLLTHTRQIFTTLEQIFVVSADEFYDNAARVYHRQPS